MTLEFSLNHAAPAELATDCLVVGVFADGPLAGTAEAVDGASSGRLAALVQRGDVSGKAGRTSLLHDLPGLAATRVLAVGLGERAKFGASQYLKAVAEAHRAAADMARLLGNSFPTGQSTPLN